jgi:hypothetical protein
MLGFTVCNLLQIMNVLLYCLQCIVNNIRFKVCYELERHILSSQPVSSAHGM